MKTDDEIAEIVSDWWHDGSKVATAFQIARHTMQIARQYGAMEAPKSAVDWERVRINAAIAAMAALAPGNAIGVYTYEEIARAGRKHADALVAELKRETGE